MALRANNFSCGMMYMDRKKVIRLLFRLWTMVWILSLEELRGKVWKCNVLLDGTIGQRKEVQKRLLFTQHINLSFIGKAGFYFTHKMSQYKKCLPCGTSLRGVGSPVINNVCTKGKKIHAQNVQRWDISIVKILVCTHRGLVLLDLFLTITNSKRFRSIH